MKRSCLQTESYCRLLLLVLSGRFVVFRAVYMRCKCIVTIDQV